jgi:hypothetical protein
LLISAAATRENVSVAPPGGNGTTSRIALVGNACAAAPADATAVNTATTVVTAIILLIFVSSMQGTVFDQEY